MTYLKIKLLFLRWKEFAWIWIMKVKNWNMKDYIQNFWEINGKLRWKSCFICCIYHVNIISIVILMMMHFMCKIWLYIHVFKFVLMKYELIWFNWILCCFNMTISLIIENQKIDFKTNITIFRVQIDFKLKWKFHLRKVKQKHATQLLTMFILKIFIWEITLMKARHLYIVIIK